MRRRPLVLLALVVPLLATLLTSCGSDGASGPSGNTQAGLESLLTQGLTARFEQGFYDVACEGALDPTVGSTRNCAVTYLGQKYTVQARVTTSDSANVTVAFNYASMPLPADPADPGSTTTTP